MVYWVFNVLVSSSHVFSLGFFFPLFPLNSEVNCQGQEVMDGAAILKRARGRVSGRNESFS